MLSSQSQPPRLRVRLWPKADLDFCSIWPETEQQLENEKPATPDQETRFAEIAITMAASVTSFSTE
jgi:hypothetical protein